MRIAHVSTSISLNQIVLGRMTYLREKGHDVVALCPNDEWAEDIRKEGIRVIDVPFERHKLLASFRAAVMMWAICLREQFDVVHTHNALPGVGGRIAARLAGVPVVVHTWHSWPLYERQNPMFSLGLKALEPIATKAAHAVLFLNPDDMQRWSELKGTSLRKARLIGNGIDIEKLVSRVRPDARRSVRHEFEISDQAFVIVKVARLEHPRKGHAFFLQGLQRFVRRIESEVAVLLIGIGKDEGLIKAEVERLGLRNVVRFGGYRRDIPSILAAADVSVLTSPYEGVPRALMESMALGLPVVATDVPGTRFLVQSGKTGLLVRFGDVEGLADALTEVLESPERAQSLGKSGRDLVSTKFNESMVVDRILRIYDHVMNTGRGQLPSWGLEAGSSSVNSR